MGFVRRAKTSAKGFISEGARKNIEYLGQSIQEWTK